MANASLVLSCLGNCAITNGPSKYDFQASVFDKKIVQFSILTTDQSATMNTSEKFNVVIQMAGREDGSGNRFIGELIITPLRNPKNITEKRAFYYDAAARVGVIMESNRSWKMVTE